MKGDDVHDLTERLQTAQPRVCRRGAPRVRKLASDGKDALILRLLVCVADREARLGDLSKAPGNSSVPPAAVSDGRLSGALNYKFPGGTAPVLTTTAVAEDDMSCWVRTTTVLICNMLANVK